MPYAEYLVYVIPGVAILAYYLNARDRIAKVSLATRDDAVSAGLVEPSSLHPVIDPARCIGCGSCVAACPESPSHTVIGLIGGKASLVSPTSCIGHGACKAACPVGAIELVFGTATRGIDLPRVSDSFESNLPGLFIAGELGGMGLIRNAVEQGRQAVESLAKTRPRGRDPLDLVIIGAGPAGFSASLAAKKAGLRFETLEQDSLGGCVFQYPRGKIVMTQPAMLPIVGKMPAAVSTKEQLLSFWQQAEKDAGLRIRYRERVEGVVRDGDTFVVQSSCGEYRASSVLLAIGRRGTPRKIGAPGEELPKVVYRLIEPEQYRGRCVLVVGGGDSALEAAASVAEAGAASVTLCYRGTAFQRARIRNRERVESAEKGGSLVVLLNSSVKQIDAHSVRVATPTGEITLENDDVIVNAGGILPDAFLKGIGIDVVTKWGEA